MEATSSDAHSLTRGLLALHSAQLEGGATEAPRAALLTAGPASGKTTLLSQLMTIALQDDRTELVPILVKVQVLQRRLLEAPYAFATAWNYIDAFLRLEHEASYPALYRMLRQAMMARRALLLLDGLDEAGAKRDEIERHVVEVLAPQGHVLLCTSRPAGIDEVRFAAFHRLTLAPLTDAQQERAFEQRLGAARAAALMLYVRGNVPRDDKGQKVTSNPLMLSMVASVFELRQGLGMPATVAELYETASNAMLARGGVTTAELMQLLQRIFFEAHVAQRRLIEDCQLDVAALGLEAPEALAKIRTEAATMPFEPFGGRAEKGHYVEVTNTGGRNGKRGVITADDRTSNPYKVTFADGTVSGWLEPNELRSSGLDEMACFQRAMARSSAAVRTACDAYLSKAMRKALDMVKELSERPDKKDWETFWDAFGRNLKLGVIEDSANRDELARLCQFSSSKSGDAMVSLKDYLGRMKDSQKAIYYLAADSKASAQRAPFLDALQRRDLEVLFLTDPIDEVAMTNLGKLGDTPLARPA